MVRQLSPKNVCRHRNLNSNFKTDQPAHTPCEKESVQGGRGDEAKTIYFAFEPNKGRAVMAFLSVATCKCV
jgi:hypothetical protein